MHPDKARARDPAFWTHERYTRLVAAFQYASSVHDRAKALLSTWMVKGVNEARIDYRLTGRGRNLTLELICDGPTDEYYQTIARYTNGFGTLQERVLVPGKGNGKALLRFYEFRSPTLFLPRFEGFTVLQRAVSGPMKGCESRGLFVERPCQSRFAKHFSVDKARPQRPRRRSSPRSRPRNSHLSAARAAAGAASGVPSEARAF